MRNYIAVLKNYVKCIDRQIIVYMQRVVYMIIQYILSISIIQLKVTRTAFFYITVFAKTSFIFIMSFEIYIHAYIIYSYI